MTPTIRRAALVLAALIALALAVVGARTRSSAADTPKAASARPALSVRAVQPELGRLPRRLNANGNIAAWQEASIGAEANGLRLLELRANVGDEVRAGQVLATFASESVQSDVALARANVLEAEANALEAAGNAERARRLKDSGALSAQQINQYLTLEQAAKARVEAARAALAQQQLRLRQTEVLAPDRGVISARSATVGAVVPGGTELFRLIRQGRLEWRAEVTSSELGRLSRGTSVLVTSASGVQVKGRVRMVAPTVNAQTRYALVYVDLPSNDAGAIFPPGRPKEKTAPSGGSAVRAATSVGAFLPGMFAQGEFALGDSSALLVPQSALVIRDGFSYVFRLGADNHVTRLKVQTGRLLGEQVEITSALDAQSRLVASGAGFLNDGDLVRVVDADQPAAAPVKAASR